MELCLVPASFVDILEIPQQTDDTLAPVNGKFRRSNLVQPSLDQALTQDIARDLALFQDGHFRISIYTVVDNPAQVLIGFTDEGFFVLQAIVVEERLADTGKAAGPIFPEELDARIVDHGLAEFPQEAEIRLPGRFQFVDAKRRSQYGQQSLAVPRRFPDVFAAAQQEILPVVDAEEED